MEKALDQADHPLRHAYLDKHLDDEAVVNGVEGLLRVQEEDVMLLGTRELGVVALCEV
jgi:hypothetical protein